MLGRGRLHCRQKSVGPHQFAQNLPQSGAANDLLDDSLLFFQLVQDLRVSPGAIFDHLETEADILSAAGCQATIILGELLEPHFAQIVSNFFYATLEPIGQKAGEHPATGCRDIKHF
jgi:hypothetical protein